ncbi:CxxC motif-containing protein [Caldicoprobacter guelmensis]|uniref:DUF1667 domain-containing protein n=1 Tax=Caldicoprobacter guelmensis TaxID=1170224 RepID=UPI00195DD895|nr:DUF1667 domain-containing protein [Caldicoprobacter guelmensis]MBM7581792.1 CxxC motif-containing protein [Caldicoprobacter guelmensis]
MELICILCPRGCRMQVEPGADGQWVVKGNGCSRGKDYALQEMTCPMRTLTTSVWVEGGTYKLVSAKTDRSIPRDKIMEALKQTKRLKVKAPVNIGDVLIENIAGTGANLVATRKVERV